jgi:hypothetical protein
VCHLLNDPRTEVAIYTSMLRKNMEGVVEGFDQHFQEISDMGEFVDVRVGGSIVSAHSSLQTGMIELFDRDYNKPDATGENQWDTIRDLPRILRHPKVAGRFDLTNTVTLTSSMTRSQQKAMNYNTTERHAYTTRQVLVEADARKSRECKDNTIVCQEYDAERVINGETEPHLVNLRRYIFQHLLPWQKENPNKPIKLGLLERPEVATSRRRHQLSRLTLTQELIERGRSAVSMGMENVRRLFGRGPADDDVLSHTLSSSCPSSPLPPVLYPHHCRHHAHCHIH